MRAPRIACRQPLDDAIGAAGLAQQPRQRQLADPSPAPAATGVAARFQPLPRGVRAQTRSRSRACHRPRSSRTSAHRIRVGSTPSLFSPSSTRSARAASPAAAASRELKHIVARAVADRAQHQSRRLIGRPSASRLSFSSSCFAASKIALDSIDDELRRGRLDLEPAARARARAASRAAPPRSPARSAPRRRAFRRRAPRPHRCAFLSSLPVTISVTTSGGGCGASSSNSAAPLSGLPLGMRSSNKRRSANSDSDCARMPQFVPGKAALDEKDACDRRSPRARAAARMASAASPTSNGSSPRHQIDRRQSPGERRRQLLGVQTQSVLPQALERARAASYSRPIRSTRSATDSTS